MNSHILLDIGNTNTKWKFKGEFFELSTENFDFKKLPKSSSVWVSNVSDKNFDVNNKFINIIESQAKYKSLTNSYDNPNSLGSDRWFGMIASYEFSKYSSFIMIDVGSAITVDVVNQSGIHLGGLIFPGLKKIRECFNNFPISSFKTIHKIGQSTEEAWTLGTLSMVVNNINQKIRELRTNCPDALIFLTGGGYSEIKEFLEFEHSYHEYLVLDGLEFFANNMG